MRQGWDCPGEDVPNQGLGRGPKLELPHCFIVHQGPWLGSRLGTRYPILAGHSTKLVGGRGHQESKDTMVAGPGLSGGHREAEALQQAGEEEEELHAGQGLPEACTAACGEGRGGVSVSLPPGQDPCKIPQKGTGSRAPHRHLLRKAGRPLASQSGPEHPGSVRGGSGRASPRRPHPSAPMTGW